jgi:dTDP-glucose 4,6-dehydratase/UDP-glucuronate decarboxylase
MTGGAGFLGYYMVQSVLHWNDRAPAANRITMTVFDNYVRGVPAWLEALKGRSDLTLRASTFAIRFRIRCPSSSTLSTRGHRVADVLPREPLETMDANIDGLRRLPRVRRCRGDQKRSFPASSFIRAARSTATPHPT